MDTLEAESKLSWISIPLSFKNSQSGQCSSPQNLDSSFRFPIQPLPSCGIMQVLLLLCWPFPQSPWQRDQGPHDDQKPFLYLVPVENSIPSKCIGFSNKQLHFLLTIRTIKIRTWCYFFKWANALSSSEIRAFTSSGSLHKSPTTRNWTGIPITPLTPYSVITWNKSWVLWLNGVLYMI